MSHKIVHEAFHHLRELLEQIHIPPPDSLDGVEEAMANLEPLDDAKNRLWDAVVETVDSMRTSAEAMYSYRAFKKLIGPMTYNLPSMLPWYVKEPSVRNMTLMATDVRRVPAPAIRQIAVHDLSVKIDMAGPHTYIIGGDDTYTTIEDGDFSWTLLHDPKLDENRLPVSQEAADFTQMFIPAEYWGDEIFGVDSSADATLFLRSVLEEFGLYKTRAVVTENIHVLNTNGPKETSESSHLGFGVRKLPEDIWVEMFEVSPLVQNGIPPKGGILNPEITPEIASTALNNLKRTFYMLKEMGIAMKSWNHLVVNKHTGEVHLGEGDRPVLVNANLLQMALANPTKFLDFVYSKDVWPHFPHLVVVGRFLDLMRGDSQLILIIKQLAEKSGTPHNMKDNVVVSQILEDFRLLAEFKRDPDLIESIENPEKRKTLLSIADYCLSILQTNGILNFWSIVVKEVVKRVRFEKWLGASISLITGAVHSGEPNIDKYWAKNIGRIQTIDEEGVIKDDEGSGGAPQNPSIGGLWGPTSGSNGPQTPQAKGSTIGGMILPNETRGRNMFYFPGASLPTYMQAHRHDIALPATPYNLNLAFWGGIGVFGILPGGVKTLLN